MDKFFELLTGLGINVTPDSSPIVLLLSSVLVLSLIAFLSFINIGIYLISLHITNHKLFLDKISKWDILLKLLNIYRKTRIGFIMFEIILFFVSQGSVIWLCYRVIIGIT